MNELKLVHNGTNQNTPRIDIAKLFGQAKSCWRTVFGKKLTVQFHQQSSKAKIRSKFDKMTFAQKRRRILQAKISSSNVDEIDI